MVKEIALQMTRARKSASAKNQVSVGLVPFVIPEVAQVSAANHVQVTVRAMLLLKFAAASQGGRVPVVRSQSASIIVKVLTARKVLAAVSSIRRTVLAAVKTGWAWLAKFLA